MNQSGGAMAKLLGLLLVVAVVASAALYLYARRQHPLALGAISVGGANDGADASTVALDADGQLRVATIVRNTGRLPVTLEGAATPSGKAEPLIVTSIGLGDGSDPTAAVTFAPVDLDPGTGVGVVVVIGVNPAYPCARLGQRPQEGLPLPAIAVRFSSYGVTTTQALAAGDAPTVTGVTRASCAAAGGT